MTSPGSKYSGALFKILYDPRYPDACEKFHKGDQDMKLFVFARQVKKSCPVLHLPGRKLGARGDMALNGLATRKFPR